MNRSVAVIAACLAVTGAVVLAQDPAPQESEVTVTPQWKQLTSLVGEWEGYRIDSGQKSPATVSVRMTGGGSALMHWIGAGTPHEMITMFHMDKNDLVATHYCAAHNQPRFRAVPSSRPDRIAFEFTGGSNIRPGDGYMKQLVLTFVDADHHNEEWGFESNGQVHTGTFYLTRVKATAKP